MLRVPALAVTSALVIAAISACYSGTKVEESDGTPTVVQSADPTEPADTTVTPTCTSKLKWSGEDKGSKRMHPGYACISCHTKDQPEAGPPPADDAGADAGHRHHGPPIFTAAGTVFGGAHDEDDCIGVSDSPTLTITDAEGTVVTLTPNAAGNFYTQQPLVFPVTASLVTEAGTRTMKGPVKSGECNGCHTATSTDPPRITE